MTSTEQLELLQKLKTMMPVQPQQFVSANSGAWSTVQYYTANVRLVEALAAEYGFTPIYVWQPTLHTTEKKLTRFEENLMRGIKADPIQQPAARSPSCHSGYARLDHAEVGAWPFRQCG